MGTSFAVWARFLLSRQNAIKSTIGSLEHFNSGQITYKVMTQHEAETTPHDPSELSLANLQSEVDTWIKTIGVTYFSELTNLAVLMEEVGELARLMSRTFGDQSFKKSDLGRNLSDEMADVLFVLVCLANQCGVDLTQAIRANLKRNQLATRIAMQIIRN